MNSPSIFPKHPCYICKKEFTIRGNMHRHMGAVHKIQPDIKKSIKCPDPDCNKVFSQLIQLRMHIQMIHKTVMEYERLKFTNFEDFQKWKSVLETETCSSYILRLVGKISSTGRKIITYVCHRSGCYNISATGKKSPKKLGTKKIGGHCPAAIRVEISKNGVKILFCKTHFGHATELGHLSLSQAEKMEIAEKLRQGVNFQKILDDAHASAHDSIRRIHLLKRHDLYNICRDFNISYVEKPSASDLNDGISLTSLPLPDKIKLLNDMVSTNILDSELYCKLNVYLDRCLTICNEASISNEVKYVSEEEEDEELPSKKIKLDHVKTVESPNIFEQTKSYSSEKISIVQKESPLRDKELPVRTGVLLHSQPTALLPVSKSPSPEVAFSTPTTPAAIFSKPAPSVVFSKPTTAAVAFSELTASVAFSKPTTTAVAFSKPTTTAVAFSKPTTAAVAFSKPTTATVEFLKPITTTVALSKQTAPALSKPTIAVAFPKPTITKPVAFSKPITTAVSLLKSTATVPSPKQTATSLNSQPILLSSLSVVPLASLNPTATVPSVNQTAAVPSLNPAVLFSKLSATPSPNLSAVPFPKLPAVPFPKLSTAPSPKLSAASSPKLSAASSPKLSAAAASPKLSAAASSPKLSAAASSPKLSAAASSPKLSAAASSPKLSAAASSPKLSAALSPKQATLPFSQLSSPALPSPQTTTSLQCSRPTVLLQTLPCSQPTVLLPSSQPTTAFPSSQTTTALACSRPTVLLQTLPCSQSTVLLPSSQTTTALPCSQPTVLLPTLPSSQSTVLFPSSQPTTALPCSQPTLLLPTLPSSQSTVLLPSSQPTVFMPTLPPGALLITNREIATIGSNYVARRIGIKCHAKEKLLAAMTSPL